MEEEQAGRRRPEEAASVRWEEAGRADQLSWVWANRVEGDQQGLLMGLSGQGSRQAAGPVAVPEAAGPEEAEEPREELRSRGVPEPGKLRERYWEGTQERYREREVKRRAKGTKQVENKHRLEKKPSWLKDPRLVETEEKEVLRVKTDENLANWVSSGQQSQRPTIRVNVYPRPHLQSQWSICHHSVGVINELAKMGDPNVLEMVQEEERMSNIETEYVFGMNEVS
nr:uncharacterized protein LOC129046392 [Mirounga angustirostris]